MIISEQYVAEFYGDSRGYDSTIDGMQSKLRAFSADLARIGAAMSISITAPLALMAREVLQAGSSFESAFAGVRKTVSGTGPELSAMREQFRSLAKEIPITANELAKIGETAGALGVKKEDIIGFTRTMADLGVTTNLTSDQAATALAHIANVMKNEAGPQYDRLGATLVALGNAGASTEKEIVSMAERLAGAGKIAGLTEANVLSFASALASVGIEAEAGGSAISRVFINMADATKLGGKELQTFAAVAGQSAAQFKKSFQDDAAGAAVSFIEGLGKITASGKSLTPVLETLELNEIRVRDALMRASGAGELFREQIQLGSKAWQENSALTKEAAERYKTFDSQLQLLKNNLTDLGITIFDKVRPALINIVDGFKAITKGIQDADPLILKAGLTVAAVFGAAGPVMLAIAGVVAFIGGPLTIAIGVLTASAAVLAGEWVLAGGKIDTSAKSIRENLSSLVSVVGGLMDVFGAFGNLVAGVLGVIALAAQYVVAPFLLIGGMLTGQFSETKAMLNDWVNSTAAFVDSRWAGMTADLDGRWTNMLNGMVKNGYAAADGFGGAGAAAGGAWSAGFANAASKSIDQALSGEYVAPKEAAKTSFKAFTLTGEEITLSAPKEKARAAGAGTAGAFLDGLTGGLKGKGGKGGGGGGGIAKALVDALEDGVTGLRTAIGKVDVGDLSVLFDKLKSKARAGAADLKDALKVVTAAINEFATAMGVGSKLNEAQVALMDKSTREALERQTLAYKTAKDEIQRIQVEGLASNKTIFAATQAEIDKMTAGAKASFAALGGVFKVMPPTLKDFSYVVKQTTGQAAGDVEKFAASSQINFSDVEAALDKLSAAAPKPFSAISIAAINAASSLRDSLGKSEMLQVINAQLDIRSSINGVIGTLEDYGKQMGLSGDALDRWVEQTIRRMPEFAGATKEALDAAIEAHKKAAIQLPGIWESVFGKLNSSAKKQISGILDILGALPSGFKKVADQIQDWVGRIDTILKGLHKLFSSIPDGLSGALQSIVSLFKQTQQQVQSSSSGILDSVGMIIKNIGGLPVAQNKPGFVDPLGLVPDLTQVAGKVAGDATKAGASIGQSITSGISSFLSGPAGIIAAITAAAGLFASTFQSQSKAIRFVGAVPIGGILGGFLSMIFGGPNELQKAQMAAQLQQARDAIKLSEQTVLQAIETTKQSMLTTLGTALDLAPLFEEFQGVSKRQIQAVFKFMTRLVNQFLEAAKQWVGVNIQQTKDIAEMVGSVFGALAQIPAAANAINSTFDVSDTQIDLVFGILNRIIERWSTLAEQWIGQASKRIKKVADRIAPALNLVGPLVQVIKDAADLKDPGNESFNVIGRTLDKIIAMVGDLAGKYEKPLLKALQNLGEKVGPALDLWKSDIEAIKASVDLPKLKESDADNAVGGMRLFIDKLIANFKDFNTDGLGRIIAIVAAISPVAEALKVWAEGSAAVKDYTKVAAQTWDDIAADFARAKDLILFMLASALDFLPKTVQFKDVMAEIAANMKAGLLSIGQGLSDAASAFNGVVNAIQGGVPPGSNPAGGGVVGGEAGQSFASSSFAPSSLGNFAPASSGASSSTINHVNIHPGAFNINLPPGSTEGDAATARRIVREEMERVFGRGGLGMQSQMA